MSKGKLFIISGASGVGKGTVIGKVLEARGDVSLSVSATTRDPRPSEVDGVHYSFITTQAFEELIAQDALAEYDFHNTTYYGTPTKQLLEKWEKGHVILDIDPKGAYQVRERYPDNTMIFLMPPSMEELERRLRKRGDTSEAQIRQRLERAKWEMEQRDQYDYVLVNDDQDRCTQEILDIISEKEHE